ncbi:2'-5' RNA ligase family protein [Enteractinococcus helveticum]|uniref:RNA 2',3'-cyclic 3'-phosphodiesterase n=1 Tax=Enteractinococcus helveticum TaxID=1837282 RepID=A0A1B7M253_9MICC|nr:2'-5' RNA ligase family protein [Enteractinococcus helveticum]OAV62651.1 hypothetical protein A6F49_05690 [Enteractinococcus helveticum]
MTRYFIGLMLPPPVQAHLTGLVNTIRAALPAQRPLKVSWNHPADLHCTLVFIGHSHDEHRLVISMTEVAAQLPATTLTLAGATHWLGRNSLAVPVKGADELGTAFIERMGQLSSDRWAGRRPFHGHVTIGRVRPRPRPAEDLFTQHIVEPVAWQATQVQLVRGTDASSGPRYRVVAHAPLAGPLNI